MTDTNRAEPMKPCPFCGGEAQFRKALWPSDGCTDAVIHAPVGDCGMGDFSTGTTDESVIAAWNRRAEVEASRLPQAGAAPSEDVTTENCWLIELRSEPGMAEAVTRYMAADGRGEPWITDPFKAMRFPTQAGAESLAGVLDRTAGGHCVAVAHAFDHFPDSPLDAQEVARDKERELNLHHFLSSHTSLSSTVSVGDVLDNWKTEDEQKERRRGFKYEAWLESQPRLEGGTQ